MQLQLCVFTLVYTRGVSFIFEQNETTNISSNNVILTLSIILSYSLTSQEYECRVLLYILPFEHLFNAIFVYLPYFVNFKRLILCNLRQKTKTYIMIAHIYTY